MYLYKLGYTCFKNCFLSAFYQSYLMRTVFVIVVLKSLLVYSVFTWFWFDMVEMMQFSLRIDLFR